VTLLASYRTGLKIALWHSLLSVVVLYAQAAELIPPRESAPGVVPGPESGLTSLPVFNVTAFWVVGLVTAAFSSLNERELRRRRADSEALATMATEMERLHRPAEIAEKLLSSLADEFGFRRGVVLSAREGVSVLAQRGAAGFAAPAAELDAVVHQAWERREPVLVKRLDPGTHPVLAALLPQGTRVLVVPLFAEGGVLGAVALEDAADRGWRIERRLVAVVTQFAAYAALALRNGWLLEQIQRMADTDGLTGVANRRAFDSALGRELARARREGGSVGLLLLDVDHFKSFNDTHGHMAGDAVLAGLAGALVEACRGFDVVARYGGEEFAVILPGCDLHESLEIAERVRRVAQRVTAPAPITVSVGVATHPDGAQDADELIAAADDALYASKRAGRDRVSAADPASSGSA
jgi:diguanylate cyclase (GGDEF)-like protein